MRANLPSTRTDRGAPPESKVRLITYVLNYDDLREPPSDVFEFAESWQGVLLGRATAADRGGPKHGRAVRLADEWMSQSHARIVRKANGDVLQDLGSKNGTFVNGVRITEHVLADHDLIEVGHTLLCYRVVEKRLAEVLSKTDCRFGPTRTRNPEVAMLLHNLRTLAPSGRPVLLLGETGTGKELAAQMLHELSARRGTYVTVDCGAVPDSLFEARFFGYVRGAFTGALYNQQGEIVRADGGTLLLDEVGNLSEAAQAKLLRVMQDGHVLPVGTTRPQEVSVRWLSATNARLHDANSSFRRDLLRRLGTTQQLPALRHRREDLGVMCAYFLGTDPATAALPRVAISAEAGRRLFCGALPGNLRQLREVLLSAALLAENGNIEDRHLLSADSSLDEPPPSAASGPDREGRPSQAELEETLRSVDGNKTAAARKLGTSVRQLYRWLKRGEPSD